MRKWFVLASALALAVGPVFAETFVIDPAHSSVTFRVKHVVGKVTGKFEKFSGTFSYDAGKPTDWKAGATIQAASINTGIEKRDNDLRSDHFLDVQKFPTLVFESTGVTDVAGDKGKLHGNLTLHGVTKPVDLDLTIGGVATDPFGKGLRAGASATGHINRLDFGVGPASGPVAGMVGKDIEIVIDVEGTSGK